MIFEFLITCDKTPDNDIRQVIADSLMQASSDFDENMVQVRHERAVNDVSEGNGNAIVGFTLDLPEYATTEHITDFVDRLLDSPQVFHLVKFEDPLLRQDLVKWGDEIFALEMKLRHVLSLIYLNAYRLVGPYELLRGDRVNPHQEGRDAEERMGQHSENQFFFIEFSEYARLNNIPDIRIAHILRIVDLETSDEYSNFRDEIMRLSRRPVEDTEDIDLFANVRRVINPIVNMRNCVAHNRRPTPDEIREYERDLPVLENLLDQYLARWEVQG